MTTQTTDNSSAPAPAPSPSPVPPADIVPGGWKPSPQLPSVDPDTARTDIEGRTPPSNIYDPNKAAPAVKSLVAGFASNTVGGPASIVELARSLKSNVDLIYEWVFNNIENLPTYGSQKGSVGAILDGLGNSFDQAALMVALLRQAGYVANFQFGTLRMTAAQAGAWLGTDPLNIWASNNYLANSGVPVSVVNVAGVDGIEFSHCWLVCTIGGTVYTFDPTQKSYTTKAAINLATATGYNATTFLTRAKTGATVTADYVQNMNRANIRADLDTFTNNLVSWIKTNNHGAALDDIIGGRQIVQTNAAVPVRQTAHPFLKAGSSVTTWTAIPQAYKATMHIVYDTINITFNSEDMAGKRLTLFFNASHQAELRLDGTLLGTSTAQTPGSWNSVLFDVVHPYPVTWPNQWVWHRVWADKPYLLCNSFGNTGRGASQVHGRKQRANIAAGNALDSEPVVGELMAGMWKKWDSHFARAGSIINRMTNCSSVLHHQCGLIGWFDTPLSDIGAISWGTSALDNNYNQQQYNDTTWGLHGVALEAQIFSEYAKVDGISTTPMIDIANSAGLRIYDAKTANWLTTVKPSLTGYAAGDLTNIENWYINAGWRVGIPSSGTLTRGSWTGYAYYAIPNFGTYGIVGGGLKGGGASCAMPLAYFVSGSVYPLMSGTYCSSPTFDSSQAGSTPVGPNGGGVVPDLGFNTGGGGNFNNNPAGDPIDMLSGVSILSQSDLSIGSQGFPYGLSFSRSYNSGSRFQDGVLGLGWSHNFSMGVQVGTDALMGMGDQSTTGAAAAIAEIFVSVDLQSDLTKPFDKYIVSALSAQWFIDNLINNCVTISTGHQMSTFVKLPGTAYAAPRGENGTVTLAGGLYKYKSLTGRTLNFNSAGQIATWVEPYGVTVTFTYTSGRLTSVSNGLGRTLTLNYTGSRLTSVSDGTGRSTSYTVDANKNLVAVTDPSGKSWTFQYDLPGRMTKLFQPANPTIATMNNVYDSLDRVMTQTDTDGNVFTYYIAGSRSEEVNPLGKSSIDYYNSAGLKVKQINEVGKIWLTTYDGRNRVLSKVAPEGNKQQFVYNANDLVTQVTAIAKPGSGLANIVNSFTYDPTWFKLKTSVDGLSRTTTYNYDTPTGNLLSIVYPTVTGVGTPTVSFTYNSRGQVLTATDPSGIVKKHVYDAATEKLTQAIMDFGTGRLNLTVNFGYNSRGDKTSVQDPKGNTSLVDYDLNRRVTQTTEPAPFSYLTKFTYDDNSNVIKVEKQTNDVLNPWQTMQATYCPCGVVWTVTDPQGHVTTMDYDAMHRLWKTTDALGRVVTRLYDDANRPLTVTDSSGTVAATYTYTDNGLRASFKDARNNTTSYTFDGFDRPSKTIYPDTTFEQITSYDANNNPLTARNRAAAVTTLTYDELNRVKTKAPASQPVVTTVRDIAGKITSMSTPVVAGNPASGTFSFFYDTAGRNFKETYPDAKSVVHVLDANGNISKTTYPDGTYFVDRVYDQLNRLTDIKLNGATTSAVQVQYDALSRRKKLIFENGVTTDYGFEIDNDLNSIIQTFVGSSLTLSYTFDNAGQMLTQQMSDGTNFMWHPGAAGTQSYGTADSVNKYPTVGGVAQTYNTNACLTGDGTWTFGYNTENMLTTATKTGTSVSYKYDPILRQRQKVVGAAKTNYYYASWQRLADYDGVANTLQQRYVYGTGLDDILIQINSAGTKTYYHSNHQGSVIATTNSTGAVVNRYKYGPFGESPSMTGTTHGYTGQRFDSDTGLYYYKMRYYSTAMGRFLQPDPIGYAGGSNLYAYVGNAPMSNFDPLGLAPKFSGVVNAAWHWAFDPSSKNVIKSGTADREFGGAIYSVKENCQTKFTYSDTPKVGGATGEVGMADLDAPNVVAFVHTHGRKESLSGDQERIALANLLMNGVGFDVDEYFSFEDVRFVATYHKPLYLATPTGQFYVLNPFNGPKEEAMALSFATVGLSATAELEQRANRLIDQSPRANRMSYNEAINKVDSKYKVLALAALLMRLRGEVGGDLVASRTGTCESKGHVSG